MSTRIQNLFREARRARGEDRLIDAHRDFAEAVNLSRQAEPLFLLVEALKGLGQIERDLGRADAAKTLIEEAVAICRDENNDLQLAHTIRHLGDIYQDLERMDEAETCYKEAVMLYGGHEQTRSLDLANAIRPFAILKERKGEIEEAVELWSKALDLYAAANVQQGVSESSARLAGLRRGEL